MEEVPPQVGKPQGLMQGLLLRSELLQEALHLHQPMGEVADGDRGEALIMRAKGFTGAGFGGDTGFREEREGFRGARGGLHAQLAHQGSGVCLGGLSGSGFHAFRRGFHAFCSGFHGFGIRSDGPRSGLHWVGLSRGGPGSLLHGFRAAAYRSRRLRLLRGGEQGTGLEGHQGRPAVAGEGKGHRRHRHGAGVRAANGLHRSRRNGFSP